MTAVTPPSEIHHTLGLTRRRRRGRALRWVAMAIAMVMAAAALLRLRAAGAETNVPYKTEMVEKGTLTVAVSATGELKPLTQVNIGTEISGIVESVAVDFNSPVRVWQILCASGSPTVNRLS